MVIVKLKDKSMGDFVLLKHVSIETNNPDVENKNGNSSPSWKVSRKLGVFIQT
jgi:hypothetical protein